MTDRTATVVWNGTLTEGNGKISSQSGALRDLPVTWASRVETPEGKTSPEELLAAAEGECYVMGLASLLTKQGHKPTVLEVRATATVERQQSGLKITTMKLDVSGDVPGLGEQEFAQLANQAEQSCPVSNALRGNVQISLQTHLSPTASRS